MADVILAVRRLVASNLGWFLETRRTLGEDAGNERAVNINAPVFDAWFPDVAEGEREVAVFTRYPRTEGQRLLDEVITDTRTVRNQGGGKNWRLAGNAIEGTYYGSVRVGDLLVMAFDRDTQTLSWIVVRGEDAQPPRALPVPAAERTAHAAIEAVLSGAPRALANMWLPDSPQAQQIVGLIGTFYPEAGRLLQAGDLGTAGTDGTDGDTYSEGNRTTVVVNRYERDPAARRACLARWGYSCAVCGFSFAERYGELGSGVIEVHHLTPLGSGDGPRQVDPVEDMRPLCSNCHTIVHRRTPPLSLAELQEALSGS